MVELIFWYLLSHIGIGALQLPDGRHVISVAPIIVLPFAQLNVSLVFILVLCELAISPLRLAMTGQWIARKE